MVGEDMYIGAVQSTLKDVGYNEAGFAFYYGSWIDYLRRSARSKSARSRVGLICEKLGREKGGRPCAAI